MYGLKDHMAGMPALHETKDVPVREKDIYFRLLTMRSEYYVAEWDGQDIMLCFVIKDRDYETAGWAWVSLDALLDQGKVVHDPTWVITSADEISKITRTKWFRYGTDERKSVDEEDT